MKQLLLNFLFFVGASLIFLQCAKLFPTKNKSIKSQSDDHAKFDNSIQSLQNDGKLNTTHTKALKLGLKTRITALFFNDPVAIDYRSIFYNPYHSLNYYDLVSKYDRKSQKVK